jgi:hypothetical protein
VDLGLLAIRVSDGRMVVKLAGSLSGAGIGVPILYSTELTPVMAVGLSDLDNSGAPDIAVLAENPSTRRYLVEIRNATGAAAPRSYLFNNGYDPLTLQLGPDTDGNSVPELAVLARRRSDGRGIVEMRNAFGPAAVHSVMFSAGYEPAAFALVTNTDANPVAEWVAALDRVANHQPYTQLINADGAANLRTTAYQNNAFSVQQVLVLSDTDSIGGPDIGVIARRKSDGRLRMEIRNARGGGTPRTFFFSP